MALSPDCNSSDSNLSSDERSDSDEVTIEGNNEEAELLVKTEAGTDNIIDEDKKMKARLEKMVVDRMQQRNNEEAKQRVNIDNSINEEVKAYIDELIAAHRKKYNESIASASDQDNEKESGESAGGNQIMEQRPGTSKSSLMQRYAGCFEEERFELKLSDEVIELAAKAFSQKQFPDKRTWVDVTSKFLMLPRHQHEQLNYNLREEDKQFKHDFENHNKFKEALKNLRISIRPLLSQVDIINENLNMFRNLGEENGISFPKDAPLKKSHGVPSMVNATNNLFYSATDKMWPVPSIEQFVQDYFPCEDGKRELNRILTSYRNHVICQHMKFFDTASKAMLDLEDRSKFFLDLFSHCDAMFRDLLYDKANKKDLHSANDESPAKSNDRYMTKTKKATSSHRERSGEADRRHKKKRSKSRSPVYQNFNKESTRQVSFADEKRHSKYKSGTDYYKERISVRKDLQN